MSFEKRSALYDEFGERKSRSTERDIYPWPPNNYIFFFLIEGETTRHNRLFILMLIMISITMILVAISVYYYKYGRNDIKASISKNPNYGLFFVFVLLFIIINLELYTPDEWEIDKDSVTLEKLIDQGHFGQVYQGVLKLQDETLKPCAVKVN